VAERIARGVVLVPEDRQAAGIVQTLEVRDNMILASLGACTVAGVLDSAKINRRVDELVRDLSIKVASARQPVTSLSGGNQQKVVIAKCLLTSPRLLLLDEPTRGIDVGAKAEITEIMGRLAEQGLGIVFASSELEEVTAIADRILVLSKGRVTGEFRRGEASATALAAAAAVGLRRKAS
jgi:erythritol transport system ATP-binding protein